MNNSDIPLSPYQEKLTAYVDDLLPPAERAAFEREHPEAAAEKATVSALGAALRAHSEPSNLRHGEFFNRRILREITPAQPFSTSEIPAWKLWRLVFAGACCALASVGIYKAAVAPDTLQTKYFAEVLSVKAGDTKLTAQVVDADGIAVVWIDGFDKLPGDYILK